MTDETGWLRERIFANERELGGMQERQRSLEGGMELVRRDMREGFEKTDRSISDVKHALGEGLSREFAHIRGEITRIDDNARRQREADEAKTRQLVTELREEAQNAESAATKERRTNRWIVVGLVVVVGLFRDSLPQMLRVLENFQ